MGRAKRTAVLEKYDGEDCYRVPLGKAKKHGTCRILQEDWDWYRAKGFSTTIRLSGGNVMVTVGDRNYTVARIIAGAQPGWRVKFANDNKKDLRRSNLLLVKGKGGSQAIKPPLKIPDRDKIWPEGADHYDYSFGGVVRTPVRDIHTGKPKDTFNGDNLKQPPGRKELEPGKIEIEGFIADKFTDGAFPAPKYSMSLRQQRRTFPGQRRIKRWGPNAAVAIEIEIETEEDQPEKE